MRISASRQLYETSKTRYQSEYLAGDLGEIFKLVLPSEERLYPQMPKKTRSRSSKHKLQKRGRRLMGLMPDISQLAYRSSINERCEYCNPESDEQRLKREATEKKERHLADLKLTLQNRSLAQGGESGCHRSGSVTQGIFCDVTMYSTHITTISRANPSLIYG